jgi:hypothetical protein
LTWAATISCCNLALEAVLLRLVCNGHESLEEARAAFGADWRDAWNRYIGSR